MIEGDLYMTSFNAQPSFLSKNGVYRLKGGDWTGETFELLTDELDWPNDVTKVDESVFGFSALAVGHGFLVPGHADGGLSIINLDDTSKKPVKISQDLDNWFYHKAFARDMDGDGDLDMVTARCRDNVIPFPWNPENKGTLIWLENPGLGKNLDGPWTEHEMVDGPDFLIDLHEHDDKFELLAPQFLTEQVNYIYLDDAGTVQNRTLDSELGNAFAAEFVDVNNDGNMDILATNHLSANGGVFAYTWDNREDLSTAKITKHTLADNINNVQKKGMAPGHSFVVFPNAEDTTGRPYILVDGDGAENYMMLSPDEDSGDDFSYTTTVLFPTECTVGKSTSADVDGDGMTEVFVPMFEKNIVRVLRFVEEGSEVPVPPLK
jgi:hypothetical protein